jgi:RNA polymerase sigma factor (TIGR02999 family)
MNRDRTARSPASDQNSRKRLMNGSSPPMAEELGTGGATVMPASSRNGGAMQGAVDELVPVVYQELRRIARAHLRRERRGHTLNTTALVHEAYVELAGFEHALWRDRSHFLAIAAQAMRRVLIDYAVARKALKRNGNAERVPLHDEIASTDDLVEELVTIDEALGRLEQLNARLARVVECRVFAGMSIDETANAVGTSPATVKRDWSVARAWLNRELRET